MEFKLKSLKLTHFKAFKEKTVEFSPDVTRIYGRNETGKTTLYDAYMWLLWGVDSLDRADYNIKTNTPDGDTLHGLDHTVEGVLEVDGQAVTLKKIYRELYTKKRGSTEKVRSGHTTDYFVNDVPLKAKDYNDRIASIVTKEQFKLLASPHYFSLVLGWKERRQILVDLFGGIEKSDVLEANPELKELPLEEYTIEEITAMNKATRTKINKLRESLPIRIDELTKSKKDYDFDTLKFRRTTITPAIEKITNELNGIAQGAEELKANQKRLQELYKERQQIEAKASEAYYSSRNKEVEQLERLKHASSEAARSIEINNKQLTQYVEQEKDTNDRIEDLRKKWLEVNGSENTQDFTCPTCRQEFPPDKIQEIKDNFNLGKSKELDRITRDAELCKTELARIAERKEDLWRVINEATDKQIDADALLANAKPIDTEMKIEFPPRHKEIEKEIEALSQIDTPDEMEMADRRLKKAKLENELKELDAMLAFEEENKNIDKRIKEYMDEEKKTAKQFAEAERMIALCESYTKTLSELVSSKINDRFEKITFKLFNEQENGGIAETCEPLIKGVPYAGANNAGKINAGLEVINALSNAYGIRIPVFVDNAEGINDVQETTGQRVDLIVTTEDEVMRIEH